MIGTENCVVFFSSLFRYKSSAGLIIYRWYELALSGLIHIVGLTWHGHCSIGYRGVVLEPAYSGNRFYAIRAYASFHPLLIEAFTVPVSRPVDLERFESDTARKPVMPTLLRIVNFGAGRQTNDCVSTVCEALRSGGLKVPHRLFTPFQLRRWLIEQGCRPVNLQF